MSARTSEVDNIPVVPDADQEYFYTVLNLPKSASDYEIRERYRQLSVIFHPDKHQDENFKATATKRFLEIQKAYKVLSDSVSRRAYDLLGPQGLRLAQDANFSSIPESELDSALLQGSRKLDADKVEGSFHPRGHVTASFDAASLFENNVDYYPIGLWERIRARAEDVTQVGFGLRYNIKKTFNGRTTLALSSRMFSQRNAPTRNALLGTIRHQYSPHLNFQATVDLLRFSLGSTKTTYQDDVNTVICEMNPLRVLRALVDARSSFAPASVSYSRRLYNNSPMEGTIMWQAMPMGPAMAVILSSAHLFDHSVEATVPPAILGDVSLNRPPSRSGLLKGARFWNVQITLTGLMSSLATEWGVLLTEIGLRIKSSIQLGLLTGLTWSFGGEWRHGYNSFGSSVVCGIESVVFKLDGSYSGQSLSCPITLSHSRDPRLALWTTAIPSAALALTYMLILRPRQRKERLRFFRDARRALHEEKADLHRETKETAHLLEEIARRHMQAEEAISGLVVLEAFYGPSERNEDNEGLDLDVTVALQALVHRSQLYIPGRRSKAGLQGFYDPVPGVMKTIRVRYTFRGYTHYAEIPDWMPVLLPLEEHLVD